MTRPDPTALIDVGKTNWNCPTCRALADALESAHADLNSARSQAQGWKENYELELNEHTRLLANLNAAKEALERIRRRGHANTSLIARGALARLGGEDTCPPHEWVDSHGIPPFHSPYCARCGKMQP
jgi:hypothetical protein